MGNAEEIAQAIKFLACDETASFVTGSNMKVSGGWELPTGGS